MKDVDARLRKLNAKLISILNRNGIYKMTTELRRENKKLRHKTNIVKNI